MTHPYSTFSYARTLSHIGEPVFVPEWNTHVLSRPIDADLMDATGVYPIAVLPVDAELQGGLSRLRDLGMVSVVLVLDDFHRPSLAALRQAFEVVRPFKTHFLRRPSEQATSYGKHHRYEIKRARRLVTTGALDLARHRSAWEALYGTLTDRHSLSGAHSFSQAHVDMLATSDGFEAIGAWHDGDLVSAHIWAVHDRRIHSHLAASSEAGYALRAAYAVNAASVEHFSTAELVNFGGVAGIASAGADGLARFKSGFANDTAPAYLCGAILRPDVYRMLCMEPEHIGPEDFFPAYRIVRQTSGT